MNEALSSIFLTADAASRDRAGAAASLDAMRWRNTFARLPPAFYTSLNAIPLAAPYLVDISDAEVSSMVVRFQDKWKFERAAAGHCTGEFAFSELNRVFGSKFDHAGVGSVIALP